VRRRQAVFTYDDVYVFLSEQLGVKREALTPGTSLLDDLGVDADDFSELADAFAHRFNVDISGYRWYFHRGEEGLNIAWVLFKPPNRRVARIRVTPKLLLESANAGKWVLEYPAHKLSPRRWDRILSLGVLCLIVLFALYLLFRKLTG
jgi:acyl carrier protein